MKENLGLGLNPPKEKCEDHKCPWHGSLSVRGKILEGVVKSTKTHKTATVEWKYIKFVRKYERYERRKSSVAAYNPDCMNAKEGDSVVIVECRALSKTKHFVIVHVDKAKADK
ncbi:MAG: 30S ribosomal protein S17 [Candidatus Aenigmarchaeota archaeon]|nr:30S ribosomal protein S17 [Candidatus Aenigmarchaeota archaeon]